MPIVRNVATGWEGSVTPEMREKLLQQDDYIDPTELDIESQVDASAGTEETTSEPVTLLDGSGIPGEEELLAHEDGDGNPAFETVGDVAAYEQRGGSLTNVHKVGPVTADEIRQWLAENGHL